jgi:APA family basic amino acid/polyamine antiporter
MNESESGSEGGRQLGFWMCLALVVGNMIGSGIFLLPANLAPLGLNAIWGWLLTIGGAMCLASVFAALAKAIPEATGPYDYVAKAMGAPPAFLVMWSYWISTWVTNSTIAIAAVSYLSTLAPGFFATPGVPALAAIAFVALFTAIACTGAQVSGKVQILTSVLKIMPLIAAMVIALIVLGQGDQTAEFAPTPVSPSNVAAAAALTLWALLGFECASVPAGRVKDPARTIPRATLIGTLAVGLIYLAASSAVFLLLPAEVATRSAAPFADLVGAYWGPTASLLVVFFAAISCLGALNGWVLLQGEVPLSLARRGVFPQWFGKVNSRGMPVRAQLLSSGLSIALVAANYTKGLTDLFARMALIATVATLVLYLIAALSALRLMWTGQMQRGFMILVTLVGVVYSVWTFYGAGRDANLWGLLLLMTAIPVWFGMRLSSLWSSPGQEAAPAAPRE